MGVGVKEGGNAPGASTALDGRETNLAGRPYLRPCRHCGHDFAGKVLWRRHRLERSERYPYRQERCLTEEQMMDKGWYMDQFGRWRDSRMRGK